MAYIKLRNSVTTIEGNPSVLYDQNANESVEVWFERSGDEAFTADEASPVVGEYQGSSAVWELFGPDGPEVFLMDDPLNANPTGSIAHPYSFLPTIPGRWLVRLTVLPYESLDGLAVTVASTPEVFTALFEIQDPNIIGHPDARPYGNGSITRGASFIAPNESNEYDSDEGWARGLERYLATVSREQGFRSTIVVYNASGMTLDAGKAVCTVNADALQAWKKADSSLQDFQNTVLHVTLAQSNNPELNGVPKFLMTETIEAGERGVAIVEGTVPFDTSAFAAGDVIFIDSNGELTSTVPTSIEATDVDARVGIVVKVGADTDLQPGFVYFHGHASMLPGFIEGPLSSTDNAVATWDGVDGNKLQNTELLVYTDPGDGSLKMRAPDNTEFYIQSGWNNGHLHLASLAGNVNIYSGISDLSSSGDVTIGTGDAPTASAGIIEIEPGWSELEGSNVKIDGGMSNTGQGGHVEITGGTAETAGLTPGGVYIQGGENTADSTVGNVFIEQAELVTVDAVYSAITTAPIVDYNGELTRWYSKDPAGVGANELRAQLSHDYGVNTKFSMLDTAGFGGLELNSDSHSFFLNKLSIGTTAAPAGVDQLVVDGSATFTDLTVTNKLNVGGLIDPIGLILTPTNQDNVIDGMAGTDGGIFISDGTDGLTPTELYFRDSAGVSHNLITGAGGAAMAGPFAPNSTEINQVATWSNTSGDAIQGSSFTMDGSGSLKTIVDSGTNLAHSMLITPSSHDAAIVNQDGADVTILSGEARGAGNGGELRLEGADATGGLPGNIRVRAGDSDLAGVDGAETHISGGDGSKIAGSTSVGGKVEISGGVGGSDGGKAALVGGSSIIDDPVVRIGTGNGGDAEVLGGTSGEGGVGGSAILRAGVGATGNLPIGISGGGGGSAIVEAGSAGIDSGMGGGEVQIKAGDGNSTSVAAGQGGNVKISAGHSPDRNVFPNALNGGDILIEAGDAGFNAANPAAIPPAPIGGEGGNIFIEPGSGDAALGPAAKHGILHLCKQTAAGLQKSYVVVGDKSLSGLPGPVGVCAGAMAHTIHGHLKVTGIIDPIAFLLEPQAANPVKNMLEAAQAAGDLDGAGNPIDANDAASQQMIRNAIWFDSANNDKMMVGDEPVGTKGTIEYDSPDAPIEYIDAEALPYSESSADGITFGHIVPDYGSKVYYYDVAPRVGVVLVDSTLGDVAVMLPDAATFKGRAMYIKDMMGLSNTSGAGQIYIVPPDGQYLDQYSYNTPYPLQPWMARQCYSNGINWFLI